jgi:hypothetical protein
MQLEQLEIESCRIRKLRNIVFYMFLGFPFFGVTLVWIVTTLGFPEEIAVPFILPYLVIYLVLGFRISNVSCPVCHGAMFRKGIFYGMGFRCVHCDYDLKDYKSSKFHK